MSNDMGGGNEVKRDRLKALLLEYMKNQNLSGRQLAARIGLSQTSVQSYLDGLTYPGVESRSAIARILGYTPTEFEAHLDGVPVEPQKKVDEVVQEIRAMSQADFLRVADAVWERIQGTLKSSI